MSGALPEYNNNNNSILTLCGDIEALTEVWGGSHGNDWGDIQRHPGQLVTPNPCQHPVLSH